MNHTHALSAHQLCFSYDGFPVLHNVDVSLPWGTVTAIEGSNGAGKSTLVELLAGTSTPRSGTINRQGEVALVVQRPAAPTALPLTVREIVALGTWALTPARANRPKKAERLERIRDALHRVRLSEIGEQPFATLSGGQRQRALLAQGLARNANILLLDEPAAGLDAESRERTRIILAEEAARGAAVACVTHDPASIAAADLVVTLEGGRRIG